MASDRFLPSNVVDIGFGQLFGRDARCPMERGLDGSPRMSLDPDGDCLPYTGGRDDFDFGAVLQKLRSMDSLPEIAKWCEDEMNRAEIASLLIQHRMWTFGVTESVRRSIHHFAPGSINFPDEPRGHTSRISDQSPQGPAPGAVPQSSALPVRDVATLPPTAPAQPPAVMVVAAGPPGTQMLVQTPAGAGLVTVPPGCGPGHQFPVALPPVGGQVLAPSARGLGDCESFYALAGRMQSWKHEKMREGIDVAEIAANARKCHTMQARSVDGITQQEYARGCLDKAMEARGYARYFHGPASGPTPDHVIHDHEVKLAKYRNALAAAKRALTEIHETSDDASVRAASGLAEISEELDGEQH